MRKFFYGLGILAALAIVVGIVGIVIVVRNGSALDAESKAYVDEAVVKISAHWSRNELMQRASPQLRASLKPNDLDALFDATTAGLGPLVNYEGAAGQSFVMATVGTGTTISAKYAAKAQYEKGSAILNIALVKVDGVWMINGFHVESNDMMSNLTGRKT